MDFLDIAMGRYNQTQTGKYYEHIPESVGVGSGETTCVAIPFDYEFVYMQSRTYKHLINNLTDEKANVTAIKTLEALSWHNGGYVVLMDGGLYRIVGIDTDKTKARKEASRILSSAFCTEYIIRLVEIDNPRGIR